MNQGHDLLRWYTKVGIRTATCETPLNRLCAQEVKTVHSTKSTILESCHTLSDLRQALETFEGCTLKKGATQLVFADGNPKAKIMLIGEAPGVEEDKQGLPFVGLSGQLLNRMFATIGLDRGSFYITNIVPWRPPGNRQPTAAEIAVCQPFLEKHIALIAPRLLIFLGGVAAKTLLNTTEGIVRMRGQWKSYMNPYLLESIPAIATFHPAYLLRSPGQKALVWQDLLAIQKNMQTFNA